ncbi:MAG: sugar ABC transporter ATP-binding protein, partial [Firmicutes bacterium]|nr:sugar ABC transporter ATP-binding protein [Bacillota bacterium]
EVFEIADRVTVLRDGQYVITKDVKDVTEDQLVTYMVGREITDIYGERAPEDKIGEEYFEVKDLYVREMFNNVSFKLRKGEILGISGLVGAGRSEMGMSVFGAIKLNRGEVWLDGKKLDIRSPHDAIKNKIGYMTEDRKEMGLFLEMMIKDNVIAADTYSYSNNALRFIDENLVRKNSDEAVEEFDIATPSITQKVGNLSGGNQQKVLLSMWYGIKPEVLIVDEPTRGVDVGAKSDIYDHLRSLARTGVGIIVISSDLMEILGISDRILVMRGGYLVGELQHDEATEEKVIAIASGVAQ